MNTPVRTATSKSRVTNCRLALGYQDALNFLDNLFDGVTPPTCREIPVVHVLNAGEVVRLADLIRIAEEKAAGSIPYKRIAHLCRRYFFELEGQSPMSDELGRPLLTKSVELVANARPPFKIIIKE